METKNLVKLQEQNYKIAAKTKELLENAIQFISSDKPNMGIYGNIEDLMDNIKRIKEKSDEKIIALIEEGKIKSLEIKIALKILKDNDEFLNIAKKCLKIVKAKRKVIKKDKKYDKEMFEISKKIFVIFDRFISDYIEKTDEKIDCAITKDVTKESIEDEIAKIGEAASLGLIEEELVNLTDYISFLVKKNREKKKKICEEEKIKKSKPYK